MITLRSVSDIRLAVADERLEHRRIGLVPTMGALHAGHLSLIRRARVECDFVVVSLFVNPSQFDDPADLDSYPRHEAHDAELAAQAGADVLFAPSPPEVYPPGFRTTVEVHGLTDRLEGVARGAAHFRGVTTVVLKLLAMTLPDVAYFGEKDAQQLLVIRRMTSDLNLPVSIVGCPTIRAPDGLALSSRNALLDALGRERAGALHDALLAAGALAAAGAESVGEIESAARAALTARGVEPEYLELVDPETLEPLERLDRPGLLALAARIGAVRLIDNAPILPVAAAFDGGGANCSRAETEPERSDRELSTCSA